MKREDGNCEDSRGWKKRNTKLQVGIEWPWNLFLIEIWYFSLSVEILTCYWYTNEIYFWVVVGKLVRAKSAFLIFVSFCYLYRYCCDCNFFFIRKVQGVFNLYKKRRRGIESSNVFLIELLENINRRAKHELFVGS